jgi:hypothetical protein
MMNQDNVESAMFAPYVYSSDSVQIWDGDTLIGTAQVINNKWSLPLSGLSIGTHAFTARSGAVASDPWEISVSSIPVITKVTDGMGTPFSANEKNESEILVLSGTAAPQSSVTVSDQSATLMTVVAGIDGTWSARLTGLSVGAHDFKAKAEGLPASSVWRIEVLPRLKHHTDFMNDKLAGWQDGAAISHSIYAWAMPPTDLPARLLIDPYGTGEAFFQVFSGLKVGASYYVDVYTGDLWHTIPPTPDRPHANVSMVSNPPGLSLPLSSDLYPLAHFNSTFIATSTSHRLSFVINNPGTPTRKIQLFGITVERQ